jgi:putative DNA primase/helicase
LAKIDTDALRANTDIVSVIGSLVALKKIGKEYQGLCPFHADKSPSFNVVPAKRMWQCWSCHAEETHGTDVIGFVQGHLGISFLEACEYLGAEKPEWKPAAPIPQVGADQPSERITSKPPHPLPREKMATRQLGEPEEVREFLDIDGSLLGYECRYKRGSDTDKPNTSPSRLWTWGAKGTQAPSWGCGHFSRPDRPLYGLHRIGKRPTFPVAVFEGPKKADAADRLIGEIYNCIAWSGGAGSWDSYDWSVVAGKDSLLWPDADKQLAKEATAKRLKIKVGDPIPYEMQPGPQAMFRLAALLAGGLGCKVRYLDVRDVDRDGYDIADMEADGMTKKDVIAWAKSPGYDGLPRARDYIHVVKPPDPPVAIVPPPADDPEDDERDAPAEETETQRPRPPQKPRLAVVNGNNALAPEVDPNVAPVTLSEDAFATEFAELHGENWRCVKAWNKWFHWDDEAWAEDRTDSRIEPMRQLIQNAAYLPEALKLTDPARRSIFGKKVPIFNSIILAGTDRRIRAEPEIWDADPWALGVPGGVVDLQSGKLVESARDQHVTMRCSVAPERGEPKLWLSMLDQWLGSDPDVIGFLRRYLGYALTGDAREQCMAFFFGRAQSGKGTILRTISGILGSLQNSSNKFRSYHYEAPIATFMESRNDRHTTELAAFYKKRLITSEEPSIGAKWDEGKLKWITGGSQITARFIAQDNFSFTMTGKIIVAANHRPRLATTDKAIKRRMMVIPFEHPVEDENRDNQLDAKLREEWPQILHWLIEGCLEWQDAGLGVPEKIADCTDQYLESEDTLGAWIEERCERERPSTTKSLYTDYSRWCTENGDNAISGRAFSNALLERGIERAKPGGQRGFKNLNLKMGEPPYTGTDF